MDFTHTAEVFPAGFDGKAFHDGLSPRKHMAGGMREIHCDDSIHTLMDYETLHNHPAVFSLPLHTNFGYCRAK